MESAGRSSGLTESRIGVSTTPGHTAVTRTPWAAASARSDRLRPATACFVIAYGVSSGAGTSPASDAVFTMCPDR